MRSGEIVDGRFEIERLAAAGGMGAVYRARDQETGLPVALKVRLGIPLPEDVLRQEREVLALALLDHPGLVQLIAHGVTSAGLPYLAMEWIEGEDLAVRIQRGPLSVTEAMALGARLAAAIGFAHARGVLHRDLKPSNIVIPQGALDQAKIIDFGVATFPEALRATLSGTTIGTPAYMAPEQARAERDLDARVDVFALGCILHECLAGRPVFAGQHLMAVLLKVLFEEVPSLRDLGHDVPPALDALIGRMLSKDPGARPADGGAVVRALDALDAGALLGPAPVVGIGRAEVRLACIVLAQAPAEPAGSPLATTVASTGASPAVRAAVSAAEARGGHPFVVRDDLIALIAQGPGFATDHAALAAGCALALRAVLPGWAIAATTGRAAVAGDRPVGAAIDQAMRRIQDRLRIAAAAAIDLDEVTAGMLDPRFVVVSGPIGLELAGEQDVAEGTRMLLGRPTSFVGRDREIGSLEALFAEAAEEPAARAALVTAPAGLGKSRLRHELVQRLRARGGVEVWMARGEAMRAGEPFGVLASLLRREAHLFVGEPIEAQRQKLLARVSRLVPAADRPRVTEFLGEMVGVAFPDDDRAELRAARRDARLLGDQMRRAWVDFVTAEAAATPLVIVLEDLHWSDLSSVEYVDAALRCLEERALLVVAFARPEVHDRFPRLWEERGAQEVWLHPLPRRACERLAREALGERATPAVIGQLWERSAGNAFFLEELLRAVAEGRDDDLPDTVLAMVESRLDVLPVEARRLLRAASVFGEVFWDGALAALLPGAHEIEAQLGLLLEREWLLARSGGRFRGQREVGFRHALVREAAYRMLPEDDRALGHRLAAAWLEAQEERDLSLLAAHYELGGEVERAARWYLTAAEQARTRHAPADADRLYDKALEGPPGALGPAEREAAYRGRGLSRYPLARYDEAMADFAHARELAHARGDTLAEIEILLDEATTLDWMAHYPSSEARVEEARLLSGTSITPRLSARLLFGLGRTAHRFDRNDQALGPLEDAVEIAALLGEGGHDTVIVASVMLGPVLLRLGRPFDSLRALERAITLCEARGDRLHLAGALNNRGCLWSEYGDKERVVADLERSSALAREFGQATLDVANEYNLGEILLWMDDGQAAEPHVARAVALDLKLSGDPGRPIVTLLEARLRLYLGDDTGVAAIITQIRAHQAEQVARGGTNPVLVPREEILCTMIELYTEDASPEAWDALEARSERFSEGQERIEVIETRAMAAAQHRRVEEARRHLERAVNLATRTPNSMGARLARRLAELPAP